MRNQVLYKIGRWQGAGSLTHIARISVRHPIPPLPRPVKRIQFWIEYVNAWMPRIEHKFSFKKDNLARLTVICICE